MYILLNTRVPLVFIYNTIPYSQDREFQIVKTSVCAIYIDGYYELIDIEVKLLYPCRLGLRVVFSLKSPL